ncbi:FAD-dependent monooxygenase [Acinetobacter sp. ANC 4779]|uniref:FAD-dependent monooxygenase n=1 Tax=Acinetobacter sp. ANC 4779 TaxID=2529848 RepID=UPI00148ED5DB|nr:FAD-dependent monooxygenase [Acinetobacter sp. ANC 4779]
MNTMQFDADVAIIGYGPSGVAAANILGKHGIKTIIFEKDKDLYSRARAVTVSDWTMRCFQAIGLDDAVAKDMDETAGLRWIKYDGTEILRMGFPPSILGKHPTSYAIYQPKMEETLRKGVERYKDHCQIYFGSTVNTVSQNAECVELNIIDENQEQRIVRVKYALGCDGGSSKTRESLNIQLVGDTVDTKWVVIDARVKRWWKNRNLLTFWSDQKRPVVDIALSLSNHRWEIPLESHETEQDFQTNEQIWPLLNSMGVTDKEVELYQHAFYRHHVRRAEKWRDGRVFLLGDAAHMMPPWAGAGMQSGIRDAFNLCWKLVEVLNERMPESVLDSYEIERAPNVEFYTQVAVQLGRIIKQQVTEEEMAVIGPQLSAEPPVLKLPEIEAGWVQNVSSSAVGKILPQPKVTDSRGKLGYLDDITDDSIFVLGNRIDPKLVMSAEQISQWDQLNVKYFTLLSAEDDGKGYDDIIDINNTLIDWLNQHKAKTVVVRPDKFIVADDINLNRPSFTF